VNYLDHLDAHQDLVAMIHLAALPGTPRARLSPEQIVDKALSEARLYQHHGISTVAIENMHDVPYTLEPGPEVTAVMAIAGREIKRLGLRCGVQVLAGGHLDALAIATAAGLDFVRVEGFVFAHVGDEGPHSACAAELMRVRRALGAEQVAVFADVKKKHAAHALTADVDLRATAEAAAFFLADGVVITGGSTGEPAQLDDLRAIADLPVRKLVGSGLTADNLSGYVPHADAFIIGSALKHGGHWSEDPDPRRVRAVVQAWRAAI